MSNKELKVAIAEDVVFQLEEALECIKINLENYTKTGQSLFIELVKMQIATANELLCYMKEEVQNERH